MTIYDVLSVMESDQPIEIVWVDYDNLHEMHEMQVFKGRVDEFYSASEHNGVRVDVIDKCEPCKILTPDDNDGTIRFVY